MQGSENDLALLDERSHALSFSLAEFFAEIFDLEVDGAAFTAVPRLFDAGLFGIHFFADVSHY